MNDKLKEQKDNERERDKLNSYRSVTNKAARQFNDLLTKGSISTVKK